MIEILKGSSVKALDILYLKKQEMTSWDLMEKAALSFVKWYVGNYDPAQALGIFCGIGNNGGDGLAIARLMHQRGYALTVFTVGELEKGTEDFKNNLKKLPSDISLIQWQEGLDLASYQIQVIVDALFGVGLNRPLEGIYLPLIEAMNGASATRVSVDIPSGLPADGILFGPAVKAQATLSFQFPKLALLLPENAQFTGVITVADIGIGNELMKNFSTHKYYVEASDVLEMHKSFNRFSHKGDFGKVLMIGGSLGKMGAIYLSGKAALRTGSGLITALVPASGLEILQVSCPEMMVTCSNGLEELKGDMPLDLDLFDAIGVGPGMGIGKKTGHFFKKILESGVKKLVIDADGLNLLAKNPDFLSFLPKGAILTPHLKEFERLAGPCRDHIERLDKCREFSAKHLCILVLKGANSVITDPEGNQYFNSTGTQYMATAGAGDVLTGMITSYLGQGYDPKHAAICGVYHHGLAGEIGSKSKRRGMLASDIIESIPETYTLLNIA